MSQREEGGKSFSDECPTTTPSVVVDRVNPQSVHLDEFLLDESHVNLTEQEYEEIGDEIPNKVISCPIQVG